MQFLRNNKNSHKDLKMGCEPSKQTDSQIQSIETDTQFRINYRELVCQDRGQIFDLYHFSSIISRNSNSIVRKVVTRGNQFSRICKIIPLNNKEYFSSISEVEFLKKLDHPNIVQIIEFFIEPSFLYIVMEDIPGNKILNEINNCEKQITFENIVQIMQQIFSALQYCHHNQIAHRSINPENVILISKQSKFIVKIVDFSRATILGSPNYPRSNDKREIALPNFQNIEAQEIDIFDCGFLFLTLIAAKKLKNIKYDDLGSVIQQYVSKLNLDNQLKDQLKDVLKDMLTITMNDKKKISQFLNYPFFKHFSPKNENKQVLQNLLSFNSNSHLRYLISMYGSLNMTCALDKAQIMMEFYNLDKNKDGEIQLEQLIQGLQNTFNIPENQARAKAEKLFQRLDKNKSGSLDFSQFVVGTMKLSKMLTNQFISSIFNELDINKDGYISKEELNNLISGLGKNGFLEGKKQLSFLEFKCVILRILKNEKDDEIQYQEF